VLFSQQPVRPWRLLLAAYHNTLTQSSLGWLSSLSCFFVCGEYAISCFDIFRRAGFLAMRRTSLVQVQMLVGTVDDEKAKEFYCVKGKKKNQHQQQQRK